MTHPPHHTSGSAEPYRRSGTVVAGCLRLDTAQAAASDFTLLAGAADWTVSSPLKKANRDLRALLYADGGHDSLYRTAGLALTSPPAFRSGGISLPGCRLLGMPPFRRPEPPSMH